MKMRATDAHLELWVRLLATEKSIFVKFLAVNQFDVPIEVTCIHVQKGHVVNISGLSHYPSDQFHIIHI